MNSLKKIIQETIIKRLKTEKKICKQENWPLIIYVEKLEKSGAIMIIQWGLSCCVRPKPPSSLNEEGVDGRPQDNRAAAAATPALYNNLLE